MTTESREDDWMAGVAPPVQRTPAEQAERNIDLVWWATWLGLLLAGVGMIAGVTMATTQQEVVECTDDYECFAYPMAAPGVAIAALAGVLAILVVFAGIAARAALRTTEE